MYLKLKYLADNISAAITINIDAIDLHLLNVNVQAIKLGSLHNVIGLSDSEIEEVGIDYLNEYFTDKPDKCLLFSKVTLTADNGSTDEFYCGGIVNCEENLENVDAYADFLEDNPDLSEYAAEEPFYGDGSCDALGGISLETIGPAIESSGRFPNGVNSEFIELISPEEISFRVWERGSGETYACGTGATAAVAAGCFTGKLESKVLVHLKGGDLEIECDMATGRCFMTGPAATVFTGEIK